MTINADALKYIKEKFPTADAIADYKVEVDYWLQQAISNPAIPLFLQSFRFLLVREEEGLLRKR